MLLKKLFNYVNHLEENWRDEIKSFLTTFVSVMVIDGALALTTIYNGDLSEAALLAVAAAAGRSAIKALLQMTFPGVFSARISKQ